MTRRYFTKAVAPAPKPPKPPKVNYRNRYVVASTMKPTGKKNVQTITLRRAVQQQGRSKGGLAIAASGKAHRWTSETAKKAAKKSWKKHGRKRQLQGRAGSRSEPVRLGRSVVRNKRIAREPLRQYYAAHITKDIWYSASDKCWYRCYDHNDIGSKHVISERQALTVLGHLAQVHGFVPEQFYEVNKGTKRAGIRDNERGSE